MTTAIVLAGGAGVRMGADTPKALLELAGRPLVAWSVAALAAAPQVSEVVLVAPAGHERAFERAVAATREVWAVVSGGASRAASLRAGLAAASPGAERVLVHDAARPLVSPELVAAVLAALADADGAIAAAPLTDTLKRGDADNAIVATIDRAGLWRAQTPQAFGLATLRAATAAAEVAGRLDAATDCASLVEAAGGRVRLVPSLTPNPKVTTPADLALAEALVAAGGRPRVGRVGG